MMFREIIKKTLYYLTLRKINVVVAILLGIERSRFGTYEALFFLRGMDKEKTVFFLLR
jgi:hypothetical protein